MFYIKSGISDHIHCFYKMYNPVLNILLLYKNNSSYMFPWYCPETPISVSNMSLKRGKNDSTSVHKFFCLSVAS